MKILQLSNLYPVPFNQRQGRAIHIPINILTKSACKIRVVCPVPYAPFPIKEFSPKWHNYSKVPFNMRVDNVMVYYPKILTFPKNLFYPLQGYFMYFGIKKLVYKLHNKFPFDLIHAHMAFPDGYAGMLLSKKFCVPLVVTARGTDVDITALRSRMSFTLLHTALKGASVIITPTPRLSRRIFDLFGLQAVTICNGIDIENTFVLRPNYDLKKKYMKKKIILSISDLDLLSKGIDINIRAMQRMIQKYSNLHYIIVGDGATRQYLENMVNELHLCGNVEFVGAKSHEEAMQYMSICDIYSMPSWRETFGLVYLEAMANGKPVIGCKYQGIDNLLTQDKCGLLSEPKDVDSHVKVLTYLIENPTEAKAMGTRGFDVVRQKYTNKKNAEKTEIVYKKMLQCS